MRKLFTDNIEPSDKVVNLSYQLWIEAIVYVKIIILDHLTKKHLDFGVACSPLPLIDGFKIETCNHTGYFLCLRKTQSREDRLNELRSTHHAGQAKDVSWILERNKHLPVKHEQSIVSMKLID